MPSALFEGQAAMTMNEERRDQGPRVLTFQGPLDAAAVQALRPMVSDLAENATGDVILDLTAVDFIDSSGIGLIVHLFKRLVGRAGGLTLVGLNGQPKQLIEYLRVDRIIATRADLPAPARAENVTAPARIDRHLEKAI